MSEREINSTEGIDWAVILMPWGRVGSNLCVDILLQSHMVRLENEPLTVNKASHPDASDQQLAAYQMEWLEDNVSKSPEGQRLIVKVAANSIADPPAFTRFLAERNARLVLMDRRDVMATVVSALRAEEYARKQEVETGVAAWSLARGKTADIIPEITLRGLRTGVRNVLSSRRICDSITSVIPPRATIWYEDLARDLDAEVARLTAAVGLTPFPYEVRYAKFTPMPLREAVANPKIIDNVAAEFGLSAD